MTASCLFSPFSVVMLSGASRPSFRAERSISPQGFIRGKTREKPQVFRKKGRRMPEQAICSGISLAQRVSLFNSYDILAFPYPSIANS
jgi:hypothetical protein